MILTVKVTQYKTIHVSEEAEQKTKQIHCGELHLVDLAGSEKIDTFGHEDKLRAAEGTSVYRLFRFLPLLIAVLYFRRPCYQ